MRLGLGGATDRLGRFGEQFGDATVGPLAGNGGGGSVDEDVAEDLAATGGTGEKAQFTESSGGNRVDSALIDRPGHMVQTLCGGDEGVVHADNDTPGLS